MRIGRRGLRGSHVLGPDGPLPDHAAKHVLRAPDEVLPPAQSSTAGRLWTTLIPLGIPFDPYSTGEWMVPDFEDLRNEDPGFLPAPAMAPDLSPDPTGL